LTGTVVGAQFDQQFRRMWLCDCSYATGKHDLQSLDRVTYRP